MMTFKRVASDHDSRFDRLSDEPIGDGRLAGKGTARFL